MPLWRLGKSKGLSKMTDEGNGGSVNDLAVTTSDQQLERSAKS
jgi:hypothetical protein